MYLFNRLRSKDALRRKYKLQIQAHVDAHHIPAVLQHHVGKVLANARRSMPNAVPTLRAFANTAYRTKSNTQTRLANARRAKASGSTTRRAPSHDPLGHIYTQWHLASAPSVPRGGRQW